MRIGSPFLLIGSIATMISCGGGGGDGGGGSSAPTTSGGGGGTTSSGTATIAATGLRVVVLIGGTTRPVGDGVYLDSRLNTGEIFILPQAPLLTNRNYTIAVNATASSDTFSHTWTFTTSNITMPTSQANELAELNNYRTRSGILAVTEQVGYLTSATKHAGYQCETSTLTHGESDNSKRFFVSNSFSDRITAGVAANGGTAWAGATTVSEDVASNGGLPAVSLLWNTVYHRLPMMRTTTSMVGIADRSDAFIHTLNVTPSQVITNTGNGYLTMNFGGNNSAAQVQSYWPHDNETNVHYVFDTNSESPDPLGANSGTDPNSAPDFDSVGPPIHIILPTTQNFNGLTITLTLVP